MNAETDMRPVILPKSNMLNADDLIAGPMTITITQARVNPDAKEQPVSIRFEGDKGRPWKPCKGMNRLLVQLWGPDSSQYTGKRLTLYRDPEVTWAGEPIGGIRISHADGLSRPTMFVVTMSSKLKKRIEVLPMSDAPAPREFEPVHHGPDAPTDTSDAPRDPVGHIRGSIARIVGQKAYAKVRAELDGLAGQMDEDVWRMLNDELELKKQALIEAAQRTQGDYNAD